MTDQIKALTVVGSGRTKAQAEADARRRGEYQFASVAPQMLPGCECTHLRYDGRRFCGLRVQVRVAAPKPSEAPKDGRAVKAPAKPSRRSPQPKVPEGSARHGARPRAKPRTPSDLAAAAERLARLLKDVAARGSRRKLAGGGTYRDFLGVIRDVALYGWAPQDGWDDAALDAIRGLYWWVREEYLAVNVLGGTCKPQPEVGDELLRLADAVIVGGVAPDKAARKLMQLAERLRPSAETATAGPQGASGFLPVVPERQHGLRQDDAERIGSTCVEAATSPEGRLRRRPSEARACPTGTVQTPQTSRRGGDGLSYRAKNRFSQKDDQARGSRLHPEHKGDGRTATTGRSRFLDAYHRLSLDGKCDGAGGMECRRVFSEWVAAGFPGDLDQFIDARANAGPWDRAPQAAEHEHVRWFNRKLDAQLKACKGDDRALGAIDTEEVAERLRYGDGSDGPSGWTLRRIAPPLAVDAGGHLGWRWKVIKGTVFTHSHRAGKAVVDEVTRRYAGVARKPLSATVVLIDADDEGNVAVSFGDLAEKLATESNLAKHCREIQWREPGPAKVQTRRAAEGLLH